MYCFNKKPTENNLSSTTSSSNPWTKVIIDELPPSSLHPWLTPQTPVMKALNRTLPTNIKSLCCHLTKIYWFNCGWQQISWMNIIENYWHNCWIDLNNCRVISSNNCFHPSRNHTVLIHTISLIADCCREKTSKLTDAWRRQPAKRRSEAWAQSSVDSRLTIAVKLPRYNQLDPQKRGTHSLPGVAAQRWQNRQCHLIGNTGCEMDDIAVGAGGKRSVVCFIWNEN